MKLLGFRGPGTDGYPFPAYANGKQGIVDNEAV